MEYFLFFLGFVILIGGASLLVDGASSVSQRMGIPPGITGLTIVAIGTSLPELIINIFASVQGNTDLAISNVLGSNVINILVIVGLTAIIKPIPVFRYTYFRDIPFGLFATILLFILVQDITLFNAEMNVLSSLDGLIFLAVLFVFMIIYFKSSRHGQLEGIASVARPWLVSILFICGGVTGLYFGGELIVDGAVFVASNFGMSQATIGLTIVAMATSLPELVTSVIASLRGNPEMAIGNAVGSCIFNILLVLGVSSVIHEQPFMPGSVIDLIVVLIATVSMIVFVYTGKGRKISRAEGMIMVGMYAAYIWFIFSRLN
jgi:cation:H+ antiporter